MNIEIRDEFKATTYPGDADYRVGLQALSAIPGAPAVVDETTLLVFTPGCLAAGRLGAGLELLDRAGFTPVFGRFFTFTEATIRRMWRYQLSTFAPDRWRLIVDLLLAGPSFLVLLRDRGSAQGTAADRLTELKGPSDPALAEPGRLRRELGGMNKILNLVHSAQETADVVRESAILLDEDEFRAAWSGTPIEGSSARRRWALSAPGSRWAGVSFAHAAALLRGRLIEAMLPDLPAWLRAMLDEELEWLENSDCRQPIIVLDSFRSHFVDHRVASSLPETVAGSPYLVAVTELEAALFGEHCDLARLWWACHQAGFFVDEWEHLIISTQCVMAGLQGTSK